MDFKTYLIEQLIKDISMGPFGSDIKKEVYQSSGIPVLNGSNLIGFKLKEDSFGYVSEEKANQLKKCNAHRGDIVVTHRGTLGQIVYIPYDSLFDRYLISQSQFRFTCDETLVIPEYFVYYFHTKIGQYKLLSNASQVGVPALARATSTFRKIEIDIPPVSYQIEVMKILSSLDSKIDTNNKLNEKLEEMAQAIFKSWFVDFEPFKDKPFHETELGMIPEGWEVSTFSSIIEKLISGDWGKETPTGNYVHKVACIRGCDFENIKNGLRGKTPERFIIERNFASKQPKPNDIVVEMSGGTATVSTGRICYITKELLDQYGGDIVCTNFCKIVRPLKGWSQYLYYYWQYKYDKKVMFCYENGTSGIKNFAINDFIDIESLLIPPKDELIKFNSIIDNIRVKIQMNGVENTRLASLRDTLLPRLMSGELIV